MFKRPKTLLLVVVVMILALIWLFCRSAEPYYQSKPLSYWIEPPRFRDAPEETMTALHAMGDKAVRHLITQLKWQPSKPKRQLRELLSDRVGRLPILQDDDPRYPATVALGKLRGAAAAAIPQLEVLANGNGRNNRWLSVVAKAALIQIKNEPLTPYINELTNASDGQWAFKAITIGHLGTNADAAVPILVEFLGSNHPVNVQTHAAIALGMIHMRPELCLKPLAELTKPANNLSARQQATITLFGFAADAKPVWNDLVPLLQDPDSWLRSYATNLLKEIDAKAALELGIK